MSPAETELDLPLLPNAEQIRRREFATARRGYDQDQVREYLRQVADQVARLEEEIRTARLEPGEAPRPAAQGGDPYAALGGRIADIVRMADEKAEETLRSAKEEAQRILSRARAEADRLRADARSQAEASRAERDELLRSAHVEADRAVSSLTARRRELSDQLQTLRERLLKAAGELEAAAAVAPDEGSGSAMGEASPAIVRPAEPRSPDPETSERGAVDPSEPETEAPAPPAEPDEDLWAATETIRVDIPDIPPLDFGPVDELGEPGASGGSREDA